MQYNDLPWNMFQVGGVLTIVSQAFVIVLRSLGEKKEVFLGSHGLFISAIPQVATRKTRPVLIIRPCSLGLVVRKICATAGSLLNLFSVISFHMWPTLDPLTLPPLQNNAGRRWEVCVFLLLCGESALRFSDLVESHFVAVAAITLAVYQNTANCFLSRLRASVCIFCRDFFFNVCVNTSFFHWLSSEMFSGDCFTSAISFLFVLFFAVMSLQQLPTTPHLVSPGVQM